MREPWFTPNVRFALWSHALAAAVWLLIFGIYAYAQLPDPELTPGSCQAMSVKRLCATKWGKDKRHVTAGMKREVFDAYGLTGNRDRSCRCKRHFEVDHLCSRELGGRDVVVNLWPQCYCGPYNAIQKDRLENRLHREVCAGRLALDKAQHMITTDWTAAYIKYFGEP